MSNRARRYYKDSGCEGPKVPKNDPNFTPTDAPCGSNAKVEVMAKRHALGLPLYHPDDSRECLTAEEKIQEVYQSIIARASQAGCKKDPTPPASFPLSVLEELKLPQIPTQV